MIKYPWGIPVKYGHKDCGQSRDKTVSKSTYFLLFFLLKLTLQLTKIRKWFVFIFHTPFPHPLDKRRFSLSHVCSLDQLVHQHCWHRKVCPCSAGSAWGQQTVEPGPLLSSAASSLIITSLLFNTLLKPFAFEARRMPSLCDVWGFILNEGKFFHLLSTGEPAWTETCISLLMLSLPPRRLFTSSPVLPRAKVPHPDQIRPTGAANQARGLNLAIRPYNLCRARNWPSQGRFMEPRLLGGHADPALRPTDRRSSVFKQNTAKKKQMIPSICGAVP